MQLTPAISSLLTLLSMPRRRSRSRSNRPTLPRFAKSCYARRLRAELLEDRRMLAIFLVDNLNNSGSGSLRQAILDANSTPGVPDTIEFASAAGEAFENGGLIRLTSELEITDTLTIDGLTAGGPVILSGDALGNDVTVAGVTDVDESLAGDSTSLDDNSRVLNFSPPFGDLTLNALTLTGGGGSGSGGGVQFLSRGRLAIADSAVSGNSTTGHLAHGGGIFTDSGSVSLTNSKVSGNSTAGSRARGGGIFTSSGSVSLINSTVSRNESYTNGGGILTRLGSVSLINSTVSGNSATGRSAVGGGILTYGGSVSLTNSTVSGNESSDDGGGIFLTGSGSVSLTNSTVSGNSATSRSAVGGGILLTGSGSVSLTNSTVSGNEAGGAGGGVFAFNTRNILNITIANSVIASNLHGVTAPGVGVPGDLVPDPDSTLTINHSLIGVADNLGTITGNTGNLTGTAASPLDPLLGPLADNGGPTRTHAPLPGSPLIDAGDPNFVTTTGADQRGNPFARVVGGRVDIGAVEVQATPTFAVGDYNRDGVVNTADYAVWRDALDPTTPVTPLSGADGDGDGFVTRRDRDVWLSHVGFAFTPPAPSPIVAELVAEAPPLQQPAFLEPEPVVTPAEPSPLATIDSAFALLTPAFAPQASPAPAAAQATVAAPVQDDSLLLLEFGVPGGLGDESDNAFADDKSEEEPADDEALSVALGAFE